MYKIYRVNRLDTRSNDCSATKKTTRIFKLPSHDGTRIPKPMTRHTPFFRTSEGTCPIALSYSNAPNQNPHSDGRNRMMPTTPQNLLITESSHH